MSMSLVQMEVKGVSNTQTQTGAYALILSETEGSRKLPIIVGVSEAQSIVMALEENIKPPRPLTHDLFKSFIERFEIVLKQVIIHKLVDGVFYSSIICERDAIEEIIDSRTSDAIALALRFGTPIFAYSTVLDNAAITESPILNFLDNKKKSPIKEKKIKKPLYKSLSMEELRKSLQKAVNEENYERAARLRDEIISRDKK